AVFGDITGAPIDGGSLGQMTLTKLNVLSSENHFIGGVRAVHRVTVETDDGPVDVYNAHLEGSGAVTDAGEEEAVIEIENVLGFIEESRTEGAPVILAGDLNAEPDESSIRRLLDAGFVDVLAEAGDPTCEQPGDPGCTSGTIPLGDNPENLTDHRIDYIFVMSGEDRAADIKEAALFLNQPVDIGGGRLLWASDHIGVRAVLELNTE
ncbi:MAG: endonuclease/exonuclease/phosphatase family protein, partial [Dehalococcoidia bacterium]|nr:endonuclease/exonuclease/phosphatase family protein [Dehalococcoidia bacterium]